MDKQHLLLNAAQLAYDFLIEFFDFGCVATDQGDLDVAPLHPVITLFERNHFPTVSALCLSTKTIVLLYVLQQPDYDLVGLPCKHFDFEAAVQPVQVRLVLLDSGQLSDGNSS